MPCLGSERPTLNAIAPQRNPDSVRTVSEQDQWLSFNERLAAVATSMGAHAVRGLFAGIRLNPNSSTGHASSTAAPKSKAAAALPVDLAQAPATTGPSIIVA